MKKNKWGVLNNYLTKDRIKEYIIKIYSGFKFIAPFVVFILILDIYGGSGAITFLGFVALFVAYRIITRWRDFKLAMQTIESKLWGKPLEKQFWSKGEKLPKVKIRWKVKK